MSKHVVLETVDQAVKQGLRLLHEREARLSELRDAWREGGESGDHRPADLVFAALARRYPIGEKAGA